jgi:predicted membrane-bound mannosyltransferase
MRLDHIASVAVDHLLGRLIRRALLAAAIAIFAVVAIYHFTVAGTLALDAQFGELEAQLIVGAIFAAAALIAFGILWAMRGQRTASSTPILSDNPREMQLVMLVEAVMLGYSLARKREPAR